MTDEADAIEETILGKVTYCRESKKIPPNFRIFWLIADNGREGFCKGWLIAHRQIEAGYRLSLTGKWFTEHQYSTYKDQFHFSDYEIISDQVSSNSLGNAERTFQKKGMISYEEVTGHILRFKWHDSNSRIFRFVSTGGNEFDCVGYLIPGKEIFEDNKLRLSGTWERNPIYGLQFKYNNYKIISPDKPEKVILRKKGSAIVNTAPKQNPVQSIASFLKDISSKKVAYEFHSPKHGTISWHVLQQLNARVIRSTTEEKVFYFLTALLDRSVLDKKVQLFRKMHREFKEDLLRCWEEAEDELEIVTGDIGLALADRKYLNSLFSKSSTFKALADVIPGKSKKDAINQLLACLKIIREKSDLYKTFNISSMVRTMTDERTLKQYLISIHGVKHKIANWSLTNITGHWFVIDDAHIKPLIKANFTDVIPMGLGVSTENADAIFEYWFGKLDEEKKEYEKFSHSQFATIFPEFPPEACEYLPFIVTQYLWFYGRFYG
jgi:hypothetical protein